MSLQVLEHQKYVSVTTYRSNGAKVSTPVWFVLEGERVYVWTDADSGKVKRLRSNPKLALAPCKMNGDPIGPSVEGTASISKDDSSPELRSAFRSKYGLVLRLSKLFTGRGHNQVFLAISPTPNST
jgi:PPOX class probable F420-dependent enzyme